MDKLTYLKKAIQAVTPLEKKAWYIYAFSFPIAKEPGDLSTYDLLDLVYTQSGMHCVIENEGVRALESITDYDKSSTLFSMEDMIPVSSEWLSTIKTAEPKRLGALIINAVVLYPVVKEKIPYMDAPITENKIETAFSSVMKDESDGVIDPSKDITIDDYISCIDRLWFFTSISNIVTMASSYKFISPPPGARELANKLLKENKDSLGDAVVVANMLDQLNKLNKDSLKDDPVARRMGDSKSEIARKKLFLMYGETNDFITTLQSKPITNAMEEGIDTSEEILPRYMNDLRYASYSRGHSTQLSGYSYKVLQRSLSGLEVSDTPCSTKVGFLRLIKEPQKLVGRQILKDSKWIPVDSLQEASAYLGKTVEVRSARNCTTPENMICYACLGISYKGYKNAMNNLAAEFSGELMTLFLKRMHTSGFSTAKIDDVDLFT